MQSKQVHASSQSPVYVEAENEGAYLKARMHALGYSVSGFARELGTTRAALHLIFQGKRKLTRNMVERVNELDPEQTLVPMWKVEVKPSTPAPKKQARAKRSSSQKSTD